MLKEVKALPVTAVLFFDIKVRVLNVVGRTFQLHITTGAEVYIFALGQLESQLFNKGGHIGVGLDFTFPALNTKHFFRHFNMHILLNRSLTGQSPAFSSFTTIKVTLFGGQHRATTFGNHTFALSAATAATTGRGQKQPRIGQCLQQLIARRYSDGFLTINDNIYITRGHQLTACSQNKGHQRQNHCGKHAYAKNNFCIHTFITFPLLQILLRYQCRRRT